MKPVMLMILDGWGIAPAGAYNAVQLAETPNLDALMAKYPHTELAASGNEVGLPKGQMGNSEVGHLNIGAGRIVYQELTRITKACEEETLFKNKVLLDCMNKVKIEGKSLHLMGLLSDGGVHSHEKHLYALLKMAKLNGLEKVFVHPFLDGRDVLPTSAPEFLEKLEQVITELGVGKIATVSGRYYAMDRDKRWERVQKAYDALTKHEGAKFASAVEGVKAAHQNGVTDEFVVPFVVDDSEDSKIKTGDGVVFFNFRPDRAREITSCFVYANFSGFERGDNAFPVNFVCMTQYDAQFNAAIAFPPEGLTNTLGEVLAQNEICQLRIAETEKYAHVTFFFNGGVEEPNPMEDRVLIPSPKVATYDLQPEMSAYLVTDKLSELLDENKYGVIILNFANPDMVGHTGVLEAGIKAMQAVDTCVGRIVEKVLALGGCVCVTADHGNLEKMYDEESAQPYTAHTVNPVPFVLAQNNKEVKLRSGVLADIAPTMLELLNIPQPKEMTGKSLLDN